MISKSVLTIRFGLVWQIISKDKQTCFILYVRSLGVTEMVCLISKEHGRPGGAQGCIPKDQTSDILK